MAWTATCEGQGRSWQQSENSKYITERLLTQATMAVMHIARLSRASVADRFAQAAAAEFNWWSHDCVSYRGHLRSVRRLTLMGRAAPSLLYTASKQALSGIPTCFAAVSQITQASASSA